MPTKINYPSSGVRGSLAVTGPINASQAISSSGYYFTDNIASNIGIDCSNLGLGGYVYWINLSTKSVILYGLTSIDGTAISANKGVEVPTVGSVEMFLKDSSKNAQKITGAYNIYWIPGQEPAYSTYNYSGTPSALNGIINAIGTANGTIAYANPYTSGKISCTPTSGQFGSTPTGAFDKSGSGEAWFTTANGDGQFWTIAFNNNVTVRMTRLQNYALSVNGDNFWQPGQTLSIYGSNDGTNWTFIYTWTMSSESLPARGVSPLFTNINFYSRYKFVVGNTNNYYLFWKEFECFGDIDGL